MLPRRLLLVGLLLGLCLAPPASAAEAGIVVDNSSPSATARGDWARASATAGFYGSDYQYRSAGQGANSFFWPFGGAEGEYQVFVRWTAGPNRATDATYVVKHQGGETQVVVNQQLGGGAWYSLGTFKLRSGVGQGVVLSDRANGVVIADAVLFAPPGQKPAEPLPADPTVRAAPSASPTPPPATPGTTPHPSPTPSPAQPVPNVTPAPTQATAPTSAAASQAAPAPEAGPGKDDPRYFPQTRYAITDDRFWDYFQKRGGVATFGYPVSNTFVLLGHKTQIYQRQVMQLRPDGSVALMNLLDNGLMPYTRINGSVFPGPDPEVVKRHPGVNDPDYHRKVLEFVREFAPDTWQELPVRFYQTFLNTVRFEDAFPDGEGDPNLLPGFSLEIWGLPTSRPTPDPGNKNFVYLRFQRGIMHYDDACKCTQGLLLADYLKSLLLGRGIPPDLLAQAKDSPFLGQYNPQKPNSINRPQQLPASELKAAFRRDPTVTVDAGHGGAEIGSSYVFPDGHRLLEKDLNLKVARKVAAALTQAGYAVVETRIADVGANVGQRDLTEDGKVTISDDLQARVDLANAAGSDLLLSIHFNGASDPAMRGTYVFYNPTRPFAERSKAFAEMAQRHLVRRLREAGYETLDRGIRTDQSVLGGNHHFYLLGPQSEIIKRESRMPAALGEALFLTNPEDANALRQERILDAIAQGYVDAVKEYFSRYEPN